MENRYLRLNPNEAESMQKQISYSKQGLSNIVAKIRNYKILRKKEVAIKNKIKLNFVALKATINQIESTLPETERKNAIDKSMQKERLNRVNEPLRANDIREIKKPKIIQEKKQEKRSIDEELEDIRSKLSEFA